MPLLTVYTSAELPSEDKVTSLLKSLSSTVARVLRKPESYVATILVPRSQMTFGGSVAPCCVVELKSIGGLNAGATAELSKDVCARLHEDLGVPTDRIYIVFQDVPAHMWGFDGATFG